MGNYHFLDGSKIRIFYRGNEKTCGRCHRTSRSCLGNGIAKECDTKGGVRVHLNDHMRKLWSEIGFVPSSFELPDSDDLNEENDHPVAEAETFSRVDTKAQTSVEDKFRFIGISIANFSLDLTDEDIRKFVVEKVGEEVKEHITIIREKKKAIVTINDSLTVEKINETMKMISFNECKLKFFGRPLYCRPLRDITPEKPDQADKTAGSQSPQKTTPTGTMQKKIPGLPASAQAKAISRKNERNRKERKEKEKKLREETTNKEVFEDEEKKQERIEKNRSAFDVLMKAQNKANHLEFDQRDKHIPDICTPAPLTSIFGQQMFKETRRMSIGSSPLLSLRTKRGAQDLSSPSSPNLINDVKKSKTGVEAKESL